MNQGWGKSGAEVRPGLEGAGSEAKICCEGRQDPNKTPFLVWGPLPTRLQGAPPPTLPH